MFVHVDEVNGTLTSGEQVRVKLPRQKLQLHTPFTVGANESVEYVFDISVFKAGRSGKYIFKPVISESGTDKEIKAVDETNANRNNDAQNDTKDAHTRDDEDEADGSALNATFVGTITRGGNATVAVTRTGTGVANATITVNDEVVGETHADGTLTFSVPDHVEIDVEIKTTNGSVELTKQFETDRGSGDDQQGSTNN